MRVDAVLMAARAISVTCAIAGAVLLGGVVHPLVGSGLRCEGLGFGCTPERDMDTLLIVAVYSATALATLLVAWQFARRGWPWRRRYGQASRSPRSPPPRRCGLSFPVIRSRRVH
jgi:hypothetical protein